MREQHSTHRPGKAHKYPVGGCTKARSPWVTSATNRSSQSVGCGRGLHTARSLENITRPHQHNPARQDNFKRNYSLRIVRKLSRLLNPRSPEPVEHEQLHLLQEPVDVHLPKRSNSDDGTRRVLSRRQILSSLREEEEETFNLRSMLREEEGSFSLHSMDHALPNHMYKTKNQDDDRYHNIRCTRSLERFIPHIQIDQEHYYDGEDTGFYIPRSKPRTIYSHSDLEPDSPSSVSPAVSRFSLSFNTRLDPLLGDPCLRWPNRRRTKSISCSPEWSTSEMSESNCSLTSSSGGKRFSRCLLIQSISKEEMRDSTSDSESVSEEPMSPGGSTCSRQSSDSDASMSSEEAAQCLDAVEPMSPGSPCSRTSDVSDSIDVDPSDEEADSKPAEECEDKKVDANHNSTKSVPTTVTCDESCDNESFSNQIYQQQQQTGSDRKVEVSELELTSLHWVGTLGIGGFGRVELVTAGVNNNQTFALKKMKKIEIQEEKHQQHILNEKNIMMSCTSPFIVKLHRTFKDSRYLYMLMEPCLGGELWTILRDKKKFEDKAARFYTACVIKAFEYLHSKGIVYRDLKPENLLLDSSGYVKLTDFGFSKQLENGEKSWTFCGTPEYVAPEMITNKTGHDQRADIWSVGILMYELLCGIPPFSKVRNNNATSGSSGAKNSVYTEILKGMKNVYFPPHMSSTAVELIRQLCRLNPAQRPSLAITRKYMWFAGMDWEGLENRTMSPPFLPKIQGAQDTSNFDNYGKDCDKPQEDFSDWDSEF